MDQSNPYAASTVALDTPAGQQVLADRGARLLAFIIDSLLGVPIGLVGGIGFAIVGNSAIGAGIVVTLVVAAGIALLVYQLMLIHRQGQTIGKRTMKVRVVRTDGSRCALLRYIGLRAIVPGIITVIPFIGPLFWLANHLCIFRENRLCLHDNIADTKVVQA